VNGDLVSRHLTLALLKRAERSVPWNGILAAYNTSCLTVPWMLVRLKASAETSDHGLPNTGTWSYSLHDGYTASKRPGVDLRPCQTPILYDSPIISAAFKLPKYLGNGWSFPSRRLQYTNAVRAALVGIGPVQVSPLQGKFIGCREKHEVIMRLLDGPVEAYGYARGQRRYVCSALDVKGDPSLGTSSHGSIVTVEIPREALNPAFGYPGAKDPSRWVWTQTEPYLWGSSNRIPLRVLSAAWPDRCSSVVQRPQ
jgi:hypothetical protein